MATFSPKPESTQKKKSFPKKTSHNLQTSNTHDARNFFDSSLRHHTRSKRHSEKNANAKKKRETLFFTRLTGSADGKIETTNSSTKISRTVPFVRSTSSDTQTQTTTKFHHTQLHIPECGELNRGFFFLCVRLCVCVAMDENTCARDAERTNSLVAALVSVLRCVESWERRRFCCERGFFIHFFYCFIDVSPFGDR